MLDIEPSRRSQVATESMAVRTAPYQEPVVAAEAAAARFETPAVDAATAIVHADSTAMHAEMVVAHDDTVTVRERTATESRDTRAVHAGAALANGCPALSRLYPLRVGGAQRSRLAFARTKTAAAALSDILHA